MELGGQFGLPSWEKIHDWEKYLPAEGLGTMAGIRGHKPKLGSVHPKPGVREAVLRPFPVVR